MPEIQYLCTELYLNPPSASHTAALHAAGGFILSPALRLLRTSRVSVLPNMALLGLRSPRAVIYCSSALPVCRWPLPGRLKPPAPFALLSGRRSRISSDLTWKESRWSSICPRRKTGSWISKPVKHRGRAEGGVGGCCRGIYHLLLQCVATKCGFSSYYLSGQDVISVHYKMTQMIAFIVEHIPSCCPHSLINIPCFHEWSPICLVMVVLCLLAAKPQAIPHPWSHRHALFVLWLLQRGDSRCKNTHACIYTAFIVFSQHVMVCLSDVRLWLDRCSRWRLTRKRALISNQPCISFSFSPFEPLKENYIWPSKYLKGFYFLCRIHQRRLPRNSILCASATKADDDWWCALIYSTSRSPAHLEAPQEEMLLQQNDENICP